jgi:hypothetical protein
LLVPDPDDPLWRMYYRVSETALEHDRRKPTALTIPEPTGWTAVRERQYLPPLRRATPSAGMIQVRFDGYDLSQHALAPAPQPDGYYCGRSPSSRQAARLPVVASGSAVRGTVQPKSSGASSSSMSEVVCQCLRGVHRV